MKKKKLHIDLMKVVKLYRDVKLRGALISKKQLVLLKEEKVINKYENIFNLSSNSNNVGAIILTNIKLIFLFHIFN